MSAEPYDIFLVLPVSPNGRERVCGDYYEDKMRHKCMYSYKQQKCELPSHSTAFLPLNSGVIELPTKICATPCNCCSCLANVGYRWRISCNRCI